MATYFTSDPHYFHKNIIEYCKRPFLRLDGQLDVPAMNRHLVTAWNNRVLPRDRVYVLGDFCFGPKTNIPLIVGKLTGYKILVRGNHDRTRTAMLAGGFDEVHDELVWVDGSADTGSGTMVYMRHHPSFDEDEWPEGVDYHLCGHVHEAWARKGNIINVGVDVSDFRPLTLAELLVRDATSSSPPA